MFGSAKEDFKKKLSPRAVYPMCFSSCSIFGGLQRTGIFLQADSHDCIEPTVSVHVVVFLPQNSKRKSLIALSESASAGVTLEYTADFKWKWALLLQFVVKSYLQ